VDALSFEKYWDLGTITPHVTERRIGEGEHSIQLVDLVQGAGDYSDPPLTDLVLTVGLSAHRTAFVNGGERFSGRAEPGHWTLFARGEANRIIIDDPSHFRGLIFDSLAADALLAALDPAGRIDLAPLYRPQSSGFVPTLVERLWNAVGSTAAAPRLYTDALAIVLIQELIRLAGTSVMPGRGGLAPWQARRAREYIMAHQAENVGLVELAAQAGLSPDHFARAFRHSFGEPPHRFLLRCRLERASELLVSSNLPIGQIALLVGYDSPQGLTRLFRRQLGTTPSQYRRIRRH